MCLVTVAGLISTQQLQQMETHSGLLYYVPVTFPLARYRAQLSLRLSSCSPHRFNCFFKIPLSLRKGIKKEQHVINFVVLPGARFHSALISVVNTVSDGGCRVMLVRELCLDFQG